MMKLIKRAFAFFAAGCVFAANGLILTVSADSKEPTGYWKLDPSKTMVWLNEEVEDGVEISGGRGTYNFIHTRTDGTWQAVHSGDKETSCNGEYVNIVMKCDEPPDILYPYQGVQLRFGASFASSKYMDSVCDDVKFYVDYSFEEYPGEYGTYSTYFADNNGRVDLGLDRTWDFPDGYGATGPGNYLFYVDSDNVFRHTFETEGGELWIRHEFNGYIKTTYFYEWVDTTESAITAGTESESDPSSEDGSLWIVQEESVTAVNSAGDDSGTEIDAGIITGDKDKSRKYNDAADAAQTAAAVDGALVVGGLTGTAISTGNKNKKKKYENVAYKMIISKDFGDSVSPGVNYNIRARIVQINKSTGAEREATELNPNITAHSDNISLKYRLAPRAAYLDTRVRMDRPIDDNYVDVTFVFKGKGGEFIEHVKFKPDYKREISLVYFKSDGTTARSLPLREGYNINKYTGRVIETSHKLYAGEDINSPWLVSVPIRQASA